MSYEIGTHFSFSESPAKERESQLWPIGMSLTFATIMEEVKIFVPKFKGASYA